MTSTQGTSKEEQDMNMQFTHAVEMTKDDMSVAMTKEKVDKKEEEKTSINTVDREDDDDDDDDDDDYSNQIEVDPRYLLMDQYVYARIVLEQNKSQEAFNNLEIIREKMKAVGITMMS